MSMRKQTILIGLFIVILTNIANAGKYNSILNIDDQMPEFDQLPTISGEPISSSNLESEVIVLVSLANHCPWVKGMDQDLVTLVKHFENKDVRVIGLSVNLREDDRLPAMIKHAEEYGYNFDYMFDESQELGRKLGATRTPEYFVFNNERKLVYMGALYNSPAKMNADGSVNHIDGEPTDFYVFDAIQAVLAGEEVAVKETRAHGCSVKYVQ